MDARLAVHEELRLRLGEEAWVEAEDGKDLGVGVRVSGCPGQHRVVVHTQVISEPQYNSVHLLWIGLNVFLL